MVMYKEIPWGKLKQRDGKVSPLLALGSRTIYQCSRVAVQSHQKTLLQDIWYLQADDFSGWIPTLLSQSTCLSVINLWFRYRSSHASPLVGSQYCDKNPVIPAKKK
jgi:hypothetical protein